MSLLEPSIAFGAALRLPSGLAFANGTGGGFPA